MAGLIAQNLLEDILSRIDIVEVISGYIPLKKAGRNYRALCPFHREKTPSFMISQDRQIYHCFGCGTGGNAFNFLMQYERLEFPEAVEILAKKAGVALPESQKQDTNTASLSAKLYDLNELTAGFYEQVLNADAGKQAKEYLLKRGIKPATIKSFRIGFAADKWDALIAYSRDKNITLALLEKAGLVIPKQGGGYYDRFRNRAIFPIFDIKSRAIGFGARVLPATSKAEGDKSLPKYINSPETPVYTKGKNLYGLNLSKDAIRENDFVAVVEGYLDFMMPFQEGFQNIVASLGTALTAEQARLIKRYTHNVVMVYDADDAGQIATLRTLDIFIEEDMHVKVVSLPQGLDPDLFVRKNGIKNFQERVKQAEGLFDYKLKVLKSQYNINEIEGKAEISAQMLPTINKFKNAVLKSEYIKKLAEELNVKEDALLQEISKIRQGLPFSGSEAPIKKEALDISPTEKLLIKLMLEEAWALERIKSELGPQDFQNQKAGRLVSAIFDLARQGGPVEAHKLISRLEDESVLQLICESALSPEMPQIDKERAIDDCIRRIQLQKIKIRKQKLHEEIKIAQHKGDKEKLHTLMREFHSLIKK